MVPRTSFCISSELLEPQVLLCGGVAHAKVTLSASLCSAIVVQSDSLVLCRASIESNIVSNRQHANRIPFYFAISQEVKCLFSTRNLFVCWFFCFFFVIPKESLQHPNRKQQYCISDVWSRAFQLSHLLAAYSPLISAGPIPVGLPEFIVAFRHFLPWSLTDMAMWLNGWNKVKSGTRSKQSKASRSIRGSTSSFMYTVLPY